MCNHFSYYYHIMSYLRIEGFFLFQAIRGQTLLMQAASRGGDETVSMLLDLGVKTDSALKWAIQSKSISKIGLLAPTAAQPDLAGILTALAAEQVQLLPPIHNLIEKAAEDKETAISGLKSAAFYGRPDMIRILSRGIDFLTDLEAQEVLREAVTSDSSETVKAVLELSSSVEPEVVRLAKKRGRVAIINQLTPEDDDKDKILATKLELKTNIQNKKHNITSAIPKSTEFRYDNELVKLLPLLHKSRSDTIPFTVLAQALHIPEVHVDQDCTEACSQKMECEKMRQVYNLLVMIVQKMGEINPIFELGWGRKPSIVGSIKEGTRAFFCNEMDVHISLNPRLTEKLQFDAEHQCLKTNKIMTEKDLLSKLMKNGTFNCNEYVTWFMETLVHTINDLDISEGYKVGNTNHKFTIAPLTTAYVPCLTCMDTTDKDHPQPRRCRHSPDCLPHQTGEPECLNDCNGSCDFFSHSKTCDCKLFTSPSITKTKIGAALHIQFPDGSCVDCDLNVPTLPISTFYDGSIKKIQNYLDSERPVGWLEERSKLEDMQAVQGSAYNMGQDSWQVRMRTINQDTVLPRQVRKSLFGTIFLEFKN